jgi:hypothetical protein
MVDENLFHQCKEYLHVEGQHFQRLPWSMNCNYFITNVIGQQVYWFICKILMNLAAGGALVAVNCRALSWSTKVKSSLYCKLKWLCDSRVLYLACGNVS